MNRNKFALPALAAAFIVSVLVAAYTLSSDGWPPPRMQTPVLVLSVTLSAVLLLLLALVVMISRCGRPGSGVRTDVYLMPAGKDDGPEPEMKGKMPDRPRG